MIQLFASDETINREELLGRLRGDHAQACLDKIEVMKGRIVAIDFSRGQWPDGHGEHIWYQVGEPGNTGFCELRTDDRCVSWGPAPGSTRAELVVEVTMRHEQWHLAQAELVENARKTSTNLVGACAG